MKKKKKNNISSQRSSLFQFFYCCRRIQTLRRHHSCRHHSTQTEMTWQIFRMQFQLNWMHKMQKAFEYVYLPFTRAVSLVDSFSFSFSCSAFSCFLSFNLLAYEMWKTMVSQWKTFWSMCNSRFHLCASLPKLKWCFVFCLVSHCACGCVIVTWMQWLHNFLAMCQNSWKHWRR